MDPSSTSTTTSTTPTSTTTRPFHSGVNPSWPRQPPTKEDSREIYDEYRPLGWPREPPRPDDIGYRPSNQPAYPRNDDRFEEQPVGTGLGVDDGSSEVVLVPGRATWFPESHNNFSTQQPHAQNSPAGLPESERGRPGHPTAYDPFPPAHSDDRQFLEQSHHSQRPLRQGRREEGQYAWDNRHKYPFGYWLTAGPKESITTDRMNGVIRPELTIGKGDPGQFSDSWDMHVGGGGPTEGLSLSSRGPWSGGGQDSHPPFSSTTALSGLSGFVVTSTSSSFELKFRGPPTSSSSSVFPFRYDRTDGRPQYGTTESSQQVRDSSFIYQHNSTTMTYPSGRGLWASNAERTQSYLGHSHSPFTQEPTYFSDRTLKRPDELGFHPVDPNRRDKDFYEPTEDSTWPRDQGREPSHVEVHDIPFGSDTKVKDPPGHAPGSYWISEIGDDADPVGSRDQRVWKDGDQHRDRQGARHGDHHGDHHGDPSEAPPVRPLPTSTSFRGTPKVPILPSGTGVTRPWLWEPLVEVSDNTALHISSPHISVEMFLCHTPHCL